MKEKKYHTVFLDCAVPLFPISSSYFIIYLFLLYSLSAIRRVGWIINKKKFQKSKFVFLFFFSVSNEIGKNDNNKNYVPKYWKTAKNEGVDEADVVYTQLRRMNLHLLDEL